MRVLVLALMLFFVFIGVSSPALAEKRAGPADVRKPSYEQPMRVVIVRHSNPICEPACPEWIAAEGQITSASPAQFRRVFKQMGNRKLPVILRSPGGSILAALEIGQMIRKRGLATGVSNTVFVGCSPFDKGCKLPVDRKGVYEGRLEEQHSFCNSACPMILAAGVDRYVGPLSSVGVHQPKTVWTRQHVRYRETYRFVRGKKKIVSRKIISRKQIREKVTYGIDKQLNRQLTRYYTSLGVDASILDDTMKAKFADIHILDGRRMDELKLRTSAESAVIFGRFQPATRLRRGCSESPIRREGPLPDPRGSNPRSSSERTC